ncbi:hypothetical protein BPUTSESOX_2324 [uncultured Gammaproteobacteria bacterium]|jgi:hypothetical protein|nr:hypothetical protein [uncultured Gammaproteobacteria bacterium]CAC9501560.1 hypothetical protein [uncultured Gammaproteobacteria bacterium]VVH51602.1 hypothetical protein BPUTSESOX_2324 [uncultured Gammaproteobacteria bacterium]
MLLFDNIFFKEGKIMYTSSHTSKLFNRVLLVTALLTTLFTTVHAR